MQRLNYIDRLKGFAILTVVAGHVYLFGMDHSESIWQDVIGSFHMPLFFIMSGYTAGKVNTWSKFIKKSKKSAKIFFLALYFYIKKEPYLAL